MGYLHSMPRPVLLSKFKKFLNSVSDDASDEDPDGGFIVVHGDGNGDSPSGKQSWNCSRTDGPLGPPCVLPRPDDFVQCYDSCPDCDAANSCDFTACLDDLAFVRALVDHVRDNYCLDADSVHLTGISNGGMFSYYAASRLGDIIARYVVHEVFYPPNHAHTPAHCRQHRPQRCESPHRIRRRPGRQSSLSHRLSWAFGQVDFIEKS